MVAPDRADRRDRARRARGDGRGRLRPARGAPHGRAAADGCPSRRRLEWTNGAVAQAFSAEDPESLRGPQFSAAWCDELAKWRHAEATFDMLQFGLRLGERPRQVITTTPRPIALFKRLIADPAHGGDACRHARRTPTIWRRLSSTTVLTRYAGTRLGRQEIDGEIIEERSGRAVDARRSSKPAASARRRRVRASWWRSIRPARRGKAPMPAASWRPGAPRTARSMCSPTTPSAGCRRRPGR